MPWVKIWWKLGMAMLVLTDYFQWLISLALTFPWKLIIVLEHPCKVTQFNNNYIQQKMGCSGQSSNTPKALYQGQYWRAWTWRVRPIRRQLRSRARPIQGNIKQPPKEKRRSPPRPSESPSCWCRHSCTPACTSSSRSRGPPASAPMTLDSLTRTRQ